jgi:L-ribulose-5-phosphate 3-epimerase
MTRRNFVLTCLATPALHAGKDGLNIGVTDWVLRLIRKPEAVAFAAGLGFEGVEISLGRKPDTDKLLLEDPDLLAQYIAEARKGGVRIAGTFLETLDFSFLKNDPKAQKWVMDAIPIAGKLDARVLHLPFYGKGELSNRSEMDYVGDVLRDLAPAAQKAGIVLALGNTVSAESNARIIERSRAGNVKVYYDVGNARDNGFDIFKEIAWLGKRIVQFHLKDKGYLGEGPIDFPLLMKTIRSTGFQGFLNLETSSPSKNIEADMKRNLAFVRNLL